VGEEKSLAREGREGRLPLLLGWEPGAKNRYARDWLPDEQTTLRFARENALEDTEGSLTGRDLPR